MLPTLLLTLLPLLTPTLSKPLQNRATPFTGDGKLATLTNGLQTGCLTSSWQITTDLTSCPCFSAGPSNVWSGYYHINSTTGPCGFDVVPFGTITGAENTQYHLKCGNVTGVAAELEVCFELYFLEMSGLFECVDMEGKEGLANCL